MLVPSKHTFKVHPVSSTERFWLEEAAKPDFNVQDAKVRLRRVLPRDFFPEQIDGRLYAGGRITPVGLWHLNPEHPRLTAIDKTIRAIKEDIEAERSPRVVAAQAIAQKTRLPIMEVARAFHSLGEIGHYFHTAKGSAAGGPDSYDQIDLTDQNSYDNYLHYEDLEDLLERFYLWRGQHLYGRDRTLPATTKQTLESALSSKPDSPAPKTKVDRMLTKIMEHPLIAILVVIGIIIIAFGNVVDGAKKVLSLAPGNSKAASSKESTDSPVSPAKSAQDITDCIDQQIAKLKGAQPFTQAGGVKCEGAGPSAKGNSRSAQVLYTAPPGFQIVVPVVVQETSNIDGTKGSIEYFGENGVNKVSVPISCRSEDKPFGAGASEQVVLQGTIERIVLPEDLVSTRAQCK